MGNEDLDIDIDYDLIDTNNTINQTKKLRRHSTAKKVSSMLKSAANVSDVSVIEIEIKFLHDNPHQPRRTYNEDSILELATTIKTEGLLQPIEVSPNGSGEYYINFGHRRVLAHKKLGLKTIKALLFNQASENELRSRALIENIQRDAMSPIDIALSLHDALRSKTFKSNVELANAIGKDQSYVGKMIKLLTMPKVVLDDLLTNKSIGDSVVLDMIRRIKNEKDCEEIYFWFIKNKPSRKDLAERIKKLSIIDKSTPADLIKETATGYKITAPKNAEMLKEIENIIKKYVN